MQLLVHPFIWMTESTDRLSKLNECFVERHDRLRQYHGYLKDKWQSHAGVLEHDARETRKAAESTVNQ